MVNRRQGEAAGISKRGNPYLRKIFIHGARAAVLRVKREGSCLGQCMRGFESQAARNVMIRATATKLPTFRLHPPSPSTPLPPNPHPLPFSPPTTTLLP